MDMNNRGWTKTIPLLYVQTKSKWETFSGCLKGALVLRKANNVLFLICPCAESQQQKRRGVALGASTYHCLRANSEGRSAGRGEKQKGTETSLTHSSTKEFQHKHEDKQRLFQLSHNQFCVDARIVKTYSKLHERLHFRELRWNKLPTLSD